MTRTTLALVSNLGSAAKLGLLLLAGLLATAPLHAQSCSTGFDLDPATKTAVESAARQYFDMSARGDVAGLKASAIPAIAGDFGSIEQAAISNKPLLAQAPPTVVGTYVLDASQAKGPLPRADFYCGIYNSPDRVAFSIPNLPVGRYAIVMEKVDGKYPITLTLILQNLGGAWKVAGYYPRPSSIGGHDGQWYLTKAREYKTKSQVYNAWLYYLTAWDLIAPVDFMSSPKLDELGEEMQSARPADMPSTEKPLSLSAAGKVFSVTGLEAVSVDDSLDLRLRYRTSNAADSAAASQDNAAVLKALVARYPEFRDAFTAAIAVATDNNGHEYGSRLVLKDLK